MTPPPPGGSGCGGCLSALFGLPLFAAAAPLVAAAVVGVVTHGPRIEGAGTLLRRAAALFGATTTVALVIFVGWGRTLDAHGPGRSATVAAFAAAVVSLVGVLVLR